MGTSLGPEYIPYTYMDPLGIIILEIVILILLITITIILSSSIITDIHLSPLLPTSPDPSSRLPRNMSHKRAVSSVIEIGLGIPNRNSLTEPFKNYFSRVSLGSPKKRVIWRCMEVCRS